MRIKETAKQLAIKFKETKSEDVFNKLYKKLYPGLKNYVKLITKDGDAAEDIVSNTMVKLYTKIDDYDETYQISTWCYKIGYNEALGWLHQNNSRVSFDFGYDPVESLDTDIVSVSHDVKNYFSDSTFSIDIDDNKYTSINTEREKYDEVVNYIYSMPSEYKEILVLKFLKNMNYEDIENSLNKVHIDKYNEYSALMELANKQGNRDLFSYLRTEKEKYKKKNMITIQTIKARVHKARKILGERFNIDIKIKDED